jgi:DNA-binding transcriptional MerR regulator
MTTTWRIGELAEQAGLTVRTLHHYDAIGLLRPSARSAAGYRLYGAAEVARLYHILALRQLGFPLEEIAACLDAQAGDASGLVARQLARVDGQLAAQRRLRAQLAQLLEVLDRGWTPSSSTFLETMEAMTRMDQYYSPEVRDRIDARGRELGQERIEEAQREWAELLDAVKAEKDAGTDVADPRVQALARRWQEKVAEFHGGDEGIRDGLIAMYDKEGPVAASRGMIDQETWDYAMRAIGWTSSDRPE